MRIQTFTIVSGTKACNARCPYCISKMTPSQGMDFKLQETNWINFRKACRLAQMNNVTTVLITGKGEPFLYPDQITKFLEHLKEFEFPLIEIQTNGLMLGKDWEKYKKYLIKWRELGLNTVALSVVHYKRNKNKEIYSPHEDYIDLPKAIARLHSIGYSVRLGCIMLKGFIDSPKTVTEFVDYCKKYNVEQLTIRSVAAPQKSEDEKVYSWSKKHELTPGQILDIGKFLEKEGNKIMTLDHGGVVYDYKGQNVCITDCLTIKPRTEDLRQLIFFPDGHLRYDWQYNGAILL